MTDWLADDAPAPVSDQELAKASEQRRRVIAARQPSSLARAARDAEQAEQDEQAAARKRPRKPARDDDGRW